MTRWHCLLWVVVIMVLVHTPAWAGEAGSQFRPGEPWEDEKAESVWPSDHRGRTGPSAFATKGTWTFQTYGSAAFGDDAGEVYTGHLGFGYHFKDDLSINLEVVGGHIEIQKGLDDSASVVGLDLLLRWHLRKRDRMTIYAELGGGFHQSDEPFPNNGTHFNFRPQVGMGLTVLIKENARLMAGARWLHISNANKDGKDNNPGFDAAMLYAGVMVPF